MAPHPPSGFFRQLLELSSMSLVIAEHAPLPMAVVEGERHRVRYVNPALCRLIDKSPEQLVGKLFVEILPEESASVTLLDRVYRTGKPETHTEERQGELNAVFWSYAMWPLIADQRPVGVMIQVTETAEFHQQTVAMNEALILGSLHQHELAEEAETLNRRLHVEIEAGEETARLLAEAARLLGEKARLLDLSNDAIIVSNLDGKISLWNKGAEKLYGWTFNEVVGLSSLSLLKTEFPKPVEEIMLRLYRDGFYSGEVIQIARDGRRIPSLCRWVLDPDSKSILTSYTDITARKLAEQEMVQVRDRAVAASRAKDDFLAALSHELRTPLTPVLLLAGEATEDPSMPATAREIFATIVKSVKLEARLIDDLLDITRITHGKLALASQVADVHIALQDAVETVRAEIEERKIVLKLNFAAGKPLMRGDPVRLQQIFWNVLRNAVKFSVAGGEVSVETVIRSPQWLSVKIVDHGIGITSEELGRLFAAFSQGDHANDGGSHRFGGLGLGLSISRMLVELHAGTIRAESPGKDQGSTFTIELPLILESISSAPAPSCLESSSDVKNVATTAMGATPRRILLVEDHASTRKALTHLLTRRHFDVVSVGSVAEAREAAVRTSFDLLLSDIGLPDGSGHELMTDLRARFGLKGIALTGYGRDDDLVRSGKAGFVAHLTKPVSVQSLDEALAKVMFAKGAEVST